jgi:hypothetical protein
LAQSQPANLVSEDESAVLVTADQKKAFIDSIVKLLERAATDPAAGGFDIVVDRLNHFFQGAPASTFALSPEARQYLTTKLKDQADRMVRPLEERQFTRPDARHVEDCMLYHAVASRVAGDGDDLTRVRRVFDWIVRQVQLVPPGSLAPPGLPQAPARPYDVLLRGMATETQGGWAERSWLFMSLCRQLGIDAGLVVYTPRADAVSPLRVQSAPKGPAFWAVVALIDGKPYLFDARIGLPIPGPDGRGVATLDEAATDPQVLARLDQPGTAPYGTTQADLASSTIQVMIESSPRFHSPRMRALEKELYGRNRLILFRDPAEEEAAFRKALGARFGGVELWGLPIEVQVRLFTDGNFVVAAQYPIQRFDHHFPLLAARMAELRGDLGGAIQMYMVRVRYPDNPVQVDDNKTPIPPAVQHDLDMYATYFLALSHLDQGNAQQAEFFFKETLRLLAGPGPEGQPLYWMFRWGARTNLGLLNAAKGDHVQAIRDFSEPTRTTQTVGNRLLARDLIWRDPFTPPVSRTGEVLTKSE